nr:hypothetical protein [Elusimicrobiota bacterium]
MSLKLYDGVSTVSLGFCLLLGYKSGLRGVESLVFASGFDGIKYAKESVFFTLHGLRRLGVRL